MYSSAFLTDRSALATSIMTLTQSASDKWGTLSIRYQRYVHLGAIIISFSFLNHYSNTHINTHTNKHTHTHSNQIFTWQFENWNSKIEWNWNISWLTMISIKIIKNANCIFFPMQKMLKNSKRIPKNEEEKQKAVLILNGWMERSGGWRVTCSRR